ncbi:hypothetical protein BUALT_Bualt07G0118900 [Buddleja alternifolia]|uniref:Tudor domain-containing protein n=1 Tax=Buddleja alternifolia TaxID=168488 RepID=A0AAV6X9F0_9LAMI|nr:hypothetical protein BUALT_Bualt07G0118900 [Buddleja alternifolia]
MASSSHDDDGSERELEDELIEVGEKLLNRSSSTEELMIFLEEAESRLGKVWQKPPQHTANSLFQIMTALMRDHLLKHTDLNIQVAVASCFNELSRITAPAFPYPDEKMKEFLKLVNIAFKQLSCESGRNYSRALEILETVAKVRSGLMMLDVDSDSGPLIVEMFQIFLNVIRPGHSPDVFEYMEVIMTMVIEESDEISFELLSPLLDSVKKENKDTSPISWELGKKVFQNCATELQPYVKEALETKNLNLDDYDEIVTSLCQDTSKGKKRVSNGALVLETEQEDGTPQSNDGNGKNGQSETDTGAPRSRRRIKPTYRIRPDEIYEHPWMKKGKNSREVFFDGNNEEKNLALTQSRQSKKKKSGINQQIETEGKEITEEIVSKKDESKDVDKMVESSMSKTEKAENSKKEKEKKSRRPYGEKLVNSRIQVWWPMDKTFYTGSVIAYDAETKKHTILYDDDETEILNLRKETWELFDDERTPVTKPLENQEVDHPSPAKEPVKIQEKTAKRKAGSSKKRDAAASSKRSKNENSSVAKSAPGSISANDEEDDERRETNVSPKDDGGNQAESGN